MAIKHTFTSEVEDGADETLVRPSNWNADHEITGDVNFAKYKAITLVCDNGATMPTSPATGQWFLHTPTGRKILYQYNGADWIPIISHGTMTVYVDKTDGTDDLNHGTAVDSNAFATVQYAINCIPGLVGGNVTINVNGEDTGETVTVQGKSLSGNYTITIQGTLSTSASGTQSANGLKGVTANHGYFTDTGNLAGVANKLAYLAADGDYRIIDSTDNNTATIVGYFTSQPLQNEAYVVYDWATILDRVLLKAGQMGVVLNDIKVEGDASTYPVELEPFSRLTLNRCYITNATTETIWLEGSITANQSLCETTVNTGAITPILTGVAILNGVKILANHDGAKGLRALYGGVGYLGKYAVGQPCVIDGLAGANKAISGVACSGNSFVGCEAQYNKIRNCDTGVVADRGGQVGATANNQYSGNTANETATAASFGYIEGA